jgi:O-acetyl-ADP-ribose deacetylase (regulator of RNase III)
LQLNIWKGDITTLQVDAIVNAANEKGLGCFNPDHNCVDNVIFRKAGPRLRLYCKKKLNKKHLKVGYPMMTPAFSLPAKNIFHVVGPVWNNKHKDIMYQQLSLCYQNVLKDAQKHNIKTLAFCCISTGIYSFPKEDAALVVYYTIVNWLQLNKYFDCKIILCVFSDEDLNIYKKIFVNSNSNINSNINKEH